jgi:hypothetical protein
MSGTNSGMPLSHLATGCEIAQYLGQSRPSVPGLPQRCPVLSGLEQGLPSIDLRTRCQIAQQLALTGNRTRGLLCLATGLVDALRHCEVGDLMAFGLVVRYQQAMVEYSRAFGIG